ncbi:uncharacterized protein DS421_17g594460 [Arachis hypogaea]|nr:uncharacterized protein DS421_17g594460 [Arachis hypogaea]
MVGCYTLSLAVFSSSSRSLVVVMPPSPLFSPLSSSIPSLSIPASIFLFVYLSLSVVLLAFYLLAWFIRSGCI